MKSKIKSIDDLEQGAIISGQSFLAGMQAIEEWRKGVEQEYKTRREQEFTRLRLGLNPYYDKVITDSTGKRIREGDEVSMCGNRYIVAQRGMSTKDGNLQFDPMVALRRLILGKTTTKTIIVPVFPIKGTKHICSELTVTRSAGDFDEILGKMLESADVDQTTLDRNVVEALASAELHESTSDIVIDPYSVDQGVVDELVNGEDFGHCSSPMEILDDQDLDPDQTPETPVLDVVEHRIYPATEKECYREDPCESPE